MKLIRYLRCLILPLFAAATTLVVGLHGQDVPPPPPKAQPSLDDTLQFILDKLRAEGTISWVATASDSAKQSSGTPFALSDEISTVRGYQGNCGFSYQQVFTREGSSPVTEFLAVDLKTVSSIAVLPWDQDWNRDQASRGRPQITLAASPMIYIVVLTRRDPRAKDPRDTSRSYLDDRYTNRFYFYDEDKANRVAKAITHAVELCGGGNKDLF